MTESERFLITLASGIELFRTRPDGTEEKRSALRSLAELSAREMHRLGVAGPGLRAQGRSVESDLPGTHVLLDRLRVHGIAELRIARGAAEADLLLLIQSLAADPDEAVPIPDGGTVSVVDVDSVLAPAEISGGAPSSPVSATAAEVHQTILGLERDPFPPDLRRQLGIVVRAVDAAFEEHRDAEAVGHLHRLLEIERTVPSDPAKRNYAIAFRHLFSRTNLPRIAEVVDDNRYSELASDVLARAGIAGAEALIRRLERSRDVDQSARYVQILGDLPECAKLLVPLVSAPEWTVACGAAQLLGEFEYAEGVKALAHGLEHADSRVRQTAAAALTRLGTADAVTHLQRALSSEDEGLRSAVATNVHGRRSGALAMPLLKVAEDEHDRPEVLRDCYAALGRIGTPVAVQALVEATKPGGRIFKRKPLAERLAALHGLALVPLPIARERLLELAEDRERAVREAARAALP